MKKRNLFRVFVLAALAAGAVFSAASCTQENNGTDQSKETAAVCGVVKDTYGNTLEDVDVIIRTTDSSKEVVAQTKSNYDGTFAVPVVPSNAGFVSFEKEGYSKVSITISKEQFSEGAVFLSPVLEFASASITGRVLNALENNTPFAGVSVSIGVQNLTTGADGVYEFKNLTLQDYTLTIACLVQAADAISAARPGARRENVENYIRRLEKLEELTGSYPGVEKAYAIQAGREVRIMVKPEEVTEDNMILLAHDLAKKIESELEYPGQIKVNVIRETKAVEYAK